MVTPHRSRSLSSRVLHSVAKRWATVTVPMVLTATLLLALGQPLLLVVGLSLVIAAGITGLLAVQAARRHLRTIPSRTPFRVAESE